MRNEIQVFLMSSLTVPLGIIMSMIKEGTTIEDFDLPDALVAEVKNNAKSIGEADWQTKCGSLSRSIQTCELLQVTFTEIIKGLNDELQALASSDDNETKH